LSEIPHDYFIETAKKISEELFCPGRGTTGYFSSGMNTMIDDIVESYAAEKNASKTWTITPLNEAAGAKHALKFMQMITAFNKDVLSRLNDTDVLMIGHNAWSRFAFSTLLPSPEKPGPGTVIENLVTGGRALYPLNNCGVLALTYQHGLFQVDKRQSGRLTFPELTMNRSAESALPNFMKTKKPALFRTELEAKVAGMIPRDASLNRFNFYVRKHHRWEKKMITISVAPTDQIASLAWSSKWGAPKGSLEITGSDSQITSEGGLVYRINGKNESLEIKAMSVDEFEAVGLLLRSYPRKITKASAS
jgi:hypothetical protein